MSSFSVFKSSKDHTWETPQVFFDKINSYYGFTLDGAASPDTNKCDYYFTEDQNSLVQEWSGTVWCNPPYGRKQVLFIDKAISEVSKGNCDTVVMLIPARTETKMWQDKIFKHATSVTFINKRLKFGGSTSNAPFSSALVVFGKCSGETGVGKYIPLRGVTCDIN